MWVISGKYYDFEKGLERAHDLEAQITREWEKRLEGAIEIAHAEQEAANNQAGEKWASKLKSAKKTINRIGISFIIGLFVFPAILIGLLLLTNLSDSTATLYPSLTIVISLLISLLRLFVFPLMVFLFISPILLLSLYIDLRTREKRGPKLNVEPRKGIGGLPRPSLSWLRLINIWEQKIGPLPSMDNGDYGAIGEKYLVQKLAQFLPDEYVCITNLMVANKLDADIVLVGPAGIWALESKYISGTIHLKNGQWSREKKFYLPGGYESHKNGDLGDIENQWIREKISIEKVIRNKFPESVKLQTPLVQGGLAFTHHDSFLDVDSSARITCGDVPYWVNSIYAVRDKVLLSRQQVILIVDALLNYSKSFQHHISLSAVDTAVNIYNERVSVLRNFFEIHEPGTANFHEDNTRQDINPEDTRGIL